MTREKIADKLEELANGIRKGKTIQEKSFGTEWGWNDMSEKRIFAFDVDRFRVKPEPKYVSFTANDWIMFSTGVIQDKAKREEYLVVSWNDIGCKLQDKYGIVQAAPVTYQELRDKYVFRCTDIPVGKEVKE